MANSVEMLSGRRKKDYAAESAAEALAAQAVAMGITPEPSGFGQETADFGAEASDELEAETTAEEEEQLVAA